MECLILLLTSSTLKPWSIRFCPKEVRPSLGLTFMPVFLANWRWERAICFCVYRP